MESSPVSTKASSSCRTKVTAFATSLVLLASPARFVAQLPEPVLDPEWDWALEASAGSLVQGTYLHEVRLWRAWTVTYGLSTGMPDHSLVVGSGAATGKPYGKGTGVLQGGYRMWRPTVSGLAPWLEVGGEWVSHDISLANALQGPGAYLAFGGDYFVTKRFALGAAATTSLVAGRTQNTLATGAWGFAVSLGGARLSAKAFF